MWAKHYTKTPAEPVDDPAAKSVTKKVLIGPHIGAENFVMRIFEVDPGGYTPRHSHPFEHEIFVLDGKAVIFLDGEQSVAEPGFAAFVPPDAEHQIRNEGTELLRFMCLVPA